jgi:ribosomal protein L32E
MAPKIRRRANKIIYLEPKTNKQWERQRNVLDAIAFKRRNPKVSMTKAAREYHTTVTTIKRYAGTTVEVRSGRYDVKPLDRIPRTLEFLTPHGYEPVTVRNSRDASRIARHHNAVRRAILTFGGDTRQLNKFANKTLRAGGKTHTFITDYPTLERLARAGALHFQDIYASPGVSQ